MLKATDLNPLETFLGVKFKNTSLLEVALTHRSSANENPKINFSNERLEFLGDSVLSIIVSHYLYSKYPTYPEGKLTATRSLLVQSKTLAKISKEIHLGDFLLMSKGEEQSGGRSNNSILADALEAVIGAIYLDQGLEITRKFIELNLLAQEKAILEAKEVVDFKSQLQEITQNTSKLSPKYELSKAEGPDHAKTFYVDVLVGPTRLSTGVGKSKQDAEQNAAQLALEKLTKKSYNNDHGS